MDELKWKWVYIPYLDAPEKQKESAIKAGYAKVYFKSEVDAKIESLKASHHAEIVDTVDAELPGLMSHLDSTVCPLCGRSGLHEEAQDEV